MDEYSLIEIGFATPEYDESVSIRTDELRKPLGISFEENDLASEFDQFHLGLYDLKTFEMLACMIFKHSDEGVLKMRQVAVRKNHQSKGLGSIMVTLAEHWAISKGFKKLELSARETAVKFYQKLNYNINGTKYTEVGIPHFKMEKYI